MISSNDDVSEQLRAAQAKIAELEADRDEWRRKFTECHPIHLDGVIRSYNLAAVIEKARKRAGHDMGCPASDSHPTAECDCSASILAAADTDAVLRERDAEKFEEGVAAVRDEIRAIPHWTDGDQGGFDLQPLGPNETSEEGAWEAVSGALGAVANPYRTEGSNDQ